MTSATRGPRALTLRQSTTLAVPGIIFYLILLFEYVLRAPGHSLLMYLVRLILHPLPQIQPNMPSLIHQQQELRKQAW